MSEAKFKAPKEVMDKLDKLKNRANDSFRGISNVLWLVSMSTRADEFNELDEWFDNKALSNTDVQLREQAVIDYVIWDKPTIELEREPHYVIEREKGFYVVYAKGGLVPLSHYRKRVPSKFAYKDGWSKEEAERLNETIKGKLVEVK